MSQVQQEISTAFTPDQGVSLPTNGDAFAPMVHAIQDGDEILVRATVICDSTVSKKPAFGEFTRNPDTGYYDVEIDYTVSVSQEDAYKVWYVQVLTNDVSAGDTLSVKQKGAPKTSRGTVVVVQSTTTTGDDQ